MLKMFGAFREIERGSKREKCVRNREKCVRNREKCVCVCVCERERERESKRGDR